MSAGSAPAPLAAADVGATSTVSSPSTADTEQTLRDLVASGDLKHAVAILMREYGDAVFTRAYRVVEDRSAAKDVLQQTFLEAYRDLLTFSGQASFKSWLLGIATHRALDAVRRKRREEQRITSEDALMTVPDDSTEQSASATRASRLRALEQCLKKLSPEVRATVLMRFQQDMSYVEMAHVSGERSVTLHARVARALPVLRRCLEDKGMAP